MPVTRGDRDGDSPMLVLVGGGHAHVQVLESMARSAWPRVRTMLVSPEPRQAYSGMIPGYLQGTYAADEIAIDLPALCAAAGAEFRAARAERVDATRRVVHTSAGPIPFTYAGLDVGSVPAGLGLPGVRENTLRPRPLHAATALRGRLDELAEDAGRGGRVHIGVVGAGAGGVEIALAAHRRIAEHGAVPRVVIFESGDRPLPDFPRRARSVLLRVFERRGIALLPEREVVAVDPGGIRLATGELVKLDVAVWTTGAAPPPLLARSDLPLSGSGFFHVDETLRSLDGTPVWGAGDCIDLIGHDLPKAGVFAVRQAPVLAANLRAALAGGEPQRYRPQRAFLSLLNTADGGALLRWRGIALHNRPAWWLKDRIDRGFVERFAIERPRHS
ncbi:MAG: FAD-dependent oxidoreductase [Gemmatimonadota bacterium]